MELATTEEATVTDCKCEYQQRRVFVCEMELVTTEEVTVMMVSMNINTALCVRVCETELATTEEATVTGGKYEYQYSCVCVNFLTVCA